MANQHGDANAPRFPEPSTPEPEAAAPRGVLERLARDAGLRSPDTIATPQMAAQIGMPIGVLRWLPLFVAGLLAILVGGLGIVVMTVL